MTFRTDIASDLTFAPLDPFFSERKDQWEHPQWSMLSLFIYLKAIYIYIFIFVSLDPP